MDVSQPTGVTLEMMSAGATVRKISLLWCMVRSPHVSKTIADHNRARLSPAVLRLSLRVQGFTRPLPSMEARDYESRTSEDINETTKLGLPGFVGFYI